MCAEQPANVEACGEPESWHLEIECQLTELVRLLARQAAREARQISFEDTHND